MQHYAARISASHLRAPGVGAADIRLYQPTVRVSGKCHFCKTPLLTLANEIAHDECSRSPVM